MAERLLRLSLTPNVRRETAVCTSTGCLWSEPLLGGGELRRAARDHAGLTGHRVTIEERWSRYVTYEPYEPEEADRGRS